MGLPPPDTRRPRPCPLPATLAATPATPRRCRQTRSPAWCFLPLLSPLLLLLIFLLRALCLVQLAIHANPPLPALQSLSIFADLLSNLTHDIALQTHHTEKLLRTRQQALHPPADGSPPPTTNPLTVVPSEILCPRCHLPQHTASTLEGPSGGAKKKFCPRLPWQNAPLHDIYGNPFPTIKDKNSKNGNGADKNNNSYAATDSPAEDAPGTVVTGKKGATGAVYFKCTSCDNEKVLSSRYAVHLEKCLGLAGRKSSRAAMAKMNSNSGSGSPMLSTVDAAGPKTGSRKPSPEKKSRSPVPGLNSTDEPAMIAVPPPPKSSFHTSSAVAANTTTTTTPKKKKKKAAAVAAAAAAAAAAALATANAALPPSTPSKIDVPFIPLPPPATALVTAPQKKRKRKAEAAAAAAAATAAAAAAGDRQGSVVDEKDVSITLSATKPPPKKQKLSAERAEKAEKGEKMEKEKSMLGEGLPIKKSQVRNFKNGRGNSPSPGMGKKERRVCFFYLIFFTIM